MQTANTLIRLSGCPGWSVFAVHMKKPWGLSYLLSAQRRLIRLGGCPGWSESLLGAQSVCWFCREAAHLLLYLNYNIFNLVHVVVLSFKHIIWAVAQQNQQNDFCTQQRLRSGWASTQSDPVWSVFAVCSVGSLIPKVSSCGQQRLIRLGRCPGWSESLLGAHVILLVLPCFASFL